MNRSQLRFRKIGRPLVWTLIFAIALFGLWSGARRLYPIETSLLSARAELWRGGVREERRAGLNTLERDACGGSSFCQCVILVHGLGDRALTWKKLLLQPSSRWVRPVRLLAVDLPGSGDSPKPEAATGYRVRTLAARVDAAAREVSGCARRLWVGNSLGGWVAAWAAIDHPQDVQRLVLVDSAGLSEGAHAMDPGLLTYPTEDSLKEFQRRAYAHPHPLPEFVWKAIAERARDGNSSQVLKAQTPEDRLDGRLSKLHVPTLIFWGKADRVIAPEAAERFHARIAGSILREEPECGHLPQKECPGALTDAINAMLSYGVM